MLIFVFVIAIIAFLIGLLVYVCSPRPKGIWICKHINGEICEIKILEVNERLITYLTPNLKCYPYGRSNERKIRERKDFEGMYTILQKDGKPV